MTVVSSGHGELALRRGDRHGDGDGIGQRALTLAQMEQRKGPGSNATHDMTTDMSKGMMVGWQRSCASSTEQMATAVAAAVAAVSEGGSESRN